MYISNPSPRPISGRVSEGASAPAAPLGAAPVPEGPGSFQVDCTLGPQVPAATALPALDPSALDALSQRLALSSVPSAPSSSVPTSSVPSSSVPSVPSGDQRVFVIGNHNTWTNWSMKDVVGMFRDRAPIQQSRDNHPLVKALEAGQPMPPGLEQAAKSLVAFYDRILSGVLKPDALAAFDALGASGAPEFERPVPNGMSALVRADGKFLGYRPTTEIEGNASLQMAVHRDDPSVHGSDGGTIDDAGQTYHVGQTLLVSPVVLDLDGDDRIATTGVSTSAARRGLAGDRLGATVAFDIDGDGRKDEIEWLRGGSDGMLVDDADGGATMAMRGDGVIDGTRLFGDQGGKFAHGFEKLARHDADEDGRLAGAELAGLKAWVDDGDARVERGELRSLAELGVSEISVSVRLERNARGESLMRSDFVRHGQRQMTEDVWFAQRETSPGPEFSANGRPAVP